jgi:hypothetical protein
VVVALSSPWELSLPSQGRFSHPDCNPDFISEVINIMRIYGLLANPLNSVSPKAICSFPKP